MKIHVYTVAWNEEVMMPFFLRHYSQFCEKIIVFDNESTDRTAEIVRACPQAELRSYSTGNETSDRSMMGIKNQAYKESRGQADWVIVCDVDEFLYHPRLIGLLRSYQWLGINFPKIRGFDMVPNCMPKADDHLAEAYRLGVPNGNFDKRIVFSPKLDMDFSPGAHHAATPPGSRESLQPKLKLLHYKMLNAEYVIQRHRMLGARLSQDNVQNNWGRHYTFSYDTMMEQYTTALANRISIDSWRERPLWLRAVTKLYRMIFARSGVSR